MTATSTPTPPTAPKTPEHPAVRQAHRSSDYTLFWAIIAACLGILAAPLLFTLWAISEARGTNSSLVDTGLPLAVALFFENFDLVFIGFAAVFFVLVMIRMMRQMYLANALHIEYSAHAWLREWANKVAKDLHMPPVEIMVTQDPIMNAFAFGFAKPYTIVLNSGTIRWTSDEQLKAIIVHEMAHIKYRHTQMGTYASFLRMLPIFGLLFSWMLDFWSRRCELTCDRLALAYLGDKQKVRDALVAIHIGPDMAPAFNDVAQQWQVYNTENTFNRFTQTFSSHPFLARRLQQLNEMETRFFPPKSATKQPTITMTEPATKERDGSDS